jgi:hypothetical protein
MKRIRIVLFAMLVTALLLAAIGGAGAQSNTNWGVEYFPNTSWSAPAATVVWVPSLLFNWGGNPPASGMPAANWTLRAARTQFYYQGTYRFEVLADDEVQVRIDNVIRIDTINRGMSGKSVVMDIPMTQGNHHVEVWYRQFTADSYLYVRETLLGGPNPTPPPPATPGTCPMPPASATSVQTQFGNYTPCIQQNIHQSNCFVSDGAWDSPNLGSIQMEPQIVIWGNCTPDQQTTMVLQQCTDPAPAKCSKTGAGWYPQ